LKREEGSFGSEDGIGIYEIKASDGEKIRERFMKEIGIKTVREITKRNRTLDLREERCTRERKTRGRVGLEVRPRQG